MPLNLSALRSRLLDILSVSADDAVAAAKVVPLLQQLLSSCCLLVAHAADVDLAGPGVHSFAPTGRYPNKPYSKWLENFAGLAGSSKGADLVATSMRCALDSGLLEERQLHGAVISMRALLGKAGAQLLQAGNRRRIANSRNDEEQARFKDALELFTERCGQLGAGKLAGMAGAPDKRKPGYVEHLQRWRTQVG